MKIELIELSGFVAAFKALRLPFNKGERSILSFYKEDFPSYFTYSSSVSINYSDLKLAQALIKRGDDHAKILRGIEVYLYLELPLYLMIELDTYRIGADVLSTSSTMHVDCKGLTGEELQQAKGDITGRYIYKRIEKFSYQALRRIYFARKDHRLPEWKEFCDFIETLPMAKELIIVENEL